MALEQFADFLNRTRNQIVGRVDDIQNDAQQVNYSLLNRVLSGDVKQLFQGGTKVEAHIQLLDPRTGGTYDPDDELEVVHTDIMRKIEAPWRFDFDYFRVTEHELDLNNGPDLAIKIKDLARIKRQGAVTSMVGRWYRYLWQRPNRTLMEAATGSKMQPYSIPCFITTNTNGGVPYTGPDGVAWTAVQTLADQENWRNQQETFNAGDPASTTDGLVRAFDRIWMSLDFRAPMIEKQYFEEETLQKFGIYTNRDGRELWLRLTRANNDRLVGNDLGGQMNSVTFAGIPVTYDSGLDTAVGLAGSNSNTLAAGRPHYYFLDLNYIKPFFHTKHYMKERAPVSPTKQPHLMITYFDTWLNFLCTSRRRQGVVFPA